MKSINLIFPHQLFQESPLFEIDAPMYLIEEYLFFKQYPFHKQKIAFHRATMTCYEDFLLTEKKFKVHYIDAIDNLSDIRKLIPVLKEQGIQHINYIDPTDNWLQKRIEQGCSKHNISTTMLPSPLFINTKEELSVFFKSDKKKYHQTTFYTEERKKRHILIDADGQPTGGKWTFDAENRKKYPAKKTPPSIQFPETDQYYVNAVKYVNKHFDNHLGHLTEYQIYPTNFKITKDWLYQFFEQRFMEFGIYEDAIVAENSILNHSVLTPMLNIGLITPKEVINSCLSYTKKHNIPINSTEGFVRQIIGWREFIRGVYETRGSEERTTNFWAFKKKIPTSFYNGTTGIPPIDQTIKKVLQTGYCHHIERLMILSNFMLLCEFDPDEVYKWFMELFIDAYDWVMVTNVYGMSQFADGGLIATKPYISGSNYIMKMSNYKKGDWQNIWDGLFWRFMHTQRDFFLSNPRLGMLIRMYDKMPEDKQQKHLEYANNYLNSLK
ncbi:cryptochrome/photolyase family protein [Formosa algae]|uniref:Deoxyribodipyrimidine photolyase-related protein n=1 Tax=Formosa algae TaxID=225843 RepID=A0A9X0YIU5_9FLAO|nr:cryptochrome/photolyase family protein [Formosa algae]MBP1839572.1 deoxyribodipyrimidine photolyase-related protein [Formosa algae]MDQ0334876.1 deoxyribodipyrimidine photolyase-related protein [Formosa algae]OEI82118.1 deoxyribodipyrimidine photolyase [Formosa algae]